MNSIRRSLVGFSLLGVILLAGAPSPAQAQTTSVGPYYATPSWDQTLPAATRFIVLSNFANAAVLDRNTGLVWEKSPDTASSIWNFARTACVTKNVGDQRGFRLPSLPELASLVDPNPSLAPGPTLPLGHPFLNIQSAFYWSATTNVVDTPRAWVVTFGDSTVTHISKGDTLHAWCVRGGMNADAY